MTTHSEDVGPQPPEGAEARHEVHASHPAVARRLNRANGHLAAVVAMIEDGRPCVEIAQQLHAVERAIARARRVLIEDHIDHCLAAAVEGTQAASKADLAEFKAITRYL